MRVRVVAAIGAGIFMCGWGGHALAQDWASMPYTLHSTYQAVNSDGSSAYAGGFPMRMRGIVLANTEDWLDPTPGYTPTYQPFVMGGQAELIIQSIEPGDFGGTFAWMGQNYGNLPFKGDPIFSYTNAEWTAELGRLGLFGGDGVTRPIRAGDLIEVRARTGLFYAGKMNVNEAHDKSPSRDFEVVLLQANYGLPAPAPLTLSDLKDATDQFIFNASRATGAEHYQGTLVELRDVRFTSATINNWGVNKDLVVEDDTGRTLTVRLGRNPSFATTPVIDDLFHVVGILDQADSTLPHDSGYRLLVMNAADFTIVPEPSASLVFLPVLLMLLRRRPRGGA